MLDTFQPLLRAARGLDLSSPADARAELERRLDPAGMEARDLNAALKQLLARVEKTIHKAPNQVRYAMNGFVIALGCYVKALTEAALKTGEKIGTVTVDMGNTACKVPFAPDYIKKVQKRGTIGKKRKTARC